MKQATRFIVDLALCFTVVDAILLCVLPPIVVFYLLHTIWQQAPKFHQVIGVLLLGGIEVASVFASLAMVVLFLAFLLAWWNRPSASTATS